MSRTLPALVASAALAATTLLGVPTASAADASVRDRAGDGSQRVLDITGLRLRNGDDDVRATVRFARSGRGTVIVYLRQRGEARYGTGVIAEHRPGGTDRVRLLTSDGTAGCEGLRGRFDDAAARASFLVPSTCLDAGDYGALRASVLTERMGGADIDHTRATDYTPRG